ncbi:MAG: Type 1 glutamine amidotransferase-like domain-containing protein [Sandaracinaceae bacterium]|nr:Type 1 glutamine amidotransferase-like domain-containing protein [Sandaracinaceae bacterium]
MRELGIDGPIATITAGWQEREPEDGELHEHLGKRTVNLKLYARTDDVWKRDPELRTAHRTRQDRLRHKQDFYRVRLEHELEAAFVIQTRTAPHEILDEEHDFSIRALQELDEAHLRQCRAEKERFDARWKPTTREAIARHRDELRQILARCAAVAIAGGHVATLLNRLELFGMDELLAGKPLFAWSAGAMAISERVVLFHDTPPQGPGAAEVLDRGLGLVPHVVPLPHPDQRLRLDDKERVGLFSRRFAPALALAFRNRTRVTWDGNAFVNAHGVERLAPDGGLERHARWSVEGRGQGESLVLAPGVGAPSESARSSLVDMTGLVPGSSGEGAGG